jgi:hypothetical protein
MSAPGQTRKSDCTIAMSAFPPLATRQRTSREVRFVPTGDIRNERGRQLRRPCSLQRWRCRRARIEKVGNGCNELGWRKRLLKKDAIGDAMCGPLVAVSASDVDDGEIRVDLPGLSCDLPSVHPAPQLYIGNKGGVGASASLEKRQGTDWQLQNFPELSRCRPNVR